VISARATSSKQSTVTTISLRVESAVVLVFAITFVGEPEQHLYPQRPTFREIVNDGRPVGLEIDTRLSQGSA